MPHGFLKKVVVVLCVVVIVVVNGGGGKKGGGGDGRQPPKPRPPPRSPAPATTATSPTDDISNILNVTGISRKCFKHDGCYRYWQPSPYTPLTFASAMTACQRDGGTVLQANTADKLLWLDRQRQKLIQHVWLGASVDESYSQDELKRLHCRIAEDKSNTMSTRNASCFERHTAYCVSDTDKDECPLDTTQCRIEDTTHCFTSNVAENSGGEGTKVVEDNWFRAQQYCKEQQLKLVTYREKYILKQDEVYCYGHTLYDLKAAPQHQTRQPTFWVNSNTPPLWKWNNGEDVSYTNWSPNHPNNELYERRCVVLEKKTSQWKVAKCSDRNLVLCQQEIVPKTSRPWSTSTTTTAIWTSEDTTSSTSEHTEWLPPDVQKKTEGEITEPEWKDIALYVAIPLAAIGVLLTIGIVLFLVRKRSRDSKYDQIRRLLSSTSSTSSGDPVYSEISDVRRNGGPRAFENSDYQGARGLTNDIIPPYNRYQSLEHNQYDNHAYDSIGERYDEINDGTGEANEGNQENQSNADIDRSGYVDRQAAGLTESRNTPVVGVSNYTAPANNNNDTRRHSYLEVLPSGEIIDDTHMHSYIDLVADEVIITETESHSTAETDNVEPPSKDTVEHSPNRVDAKPGECSQKLNIHDLINTFSDENTN